jgi:hypothetical protein
MIWLVIIAFFVVLFVAAYLSPYAESILSEWREERRELRRQRNHEQVVESVKAVIGDYKENVEILLQEHSCSYTIWFLGVGSGSPARLKKRYARGSNKTNR